jgi:hypothetical protein
MENIKLFVWTTKDLWNEIEYLYHTQIIKDINSIKVETLYDWFTILDDILWLFKISYTSDDLINNIY